MIRLLAVLLTLLGCLAGCRSQATTQLPDQTAIDDNSLGSGDVFEVRVFGEKDMTGTYQVASNGTIQFPFLGTLEVKGKETSDVAKLIADGLREGNYLTNPQVSVFLTQSNSKRISVLGAVAKPGTLPIVPGMTLVHAVSQAGGFTALASKDDTVVTRRLDGKLKRYRVEVSKITRGDAADMPLRAGDIVFVPERVF